MKKKTKSDKIEAAAQESPAEEKIDAADWQTVEEEQVQEKAEAAAETKEDAAPQPDPVEELKKELAEAKDKYMYLQAEYQNFRRRAAKDVTDARAYAVADTLVPFLTVFDYLSMAETAASKSDNIEAIRQGLQMIIGQFFKAFEELGVTKFESVGKDFDPQLHDAVTTEPSEEVPEGKVIREWCGGFKIGEKLLRPARVVVSGGKPAEEKAENQEKAE